MNLPASLLLPFFQKFLLIYMYMSLLSHYCTEYAKFGGSLAIM